MKSILKYYVKPLILTKQNDNGQDTVWIVYQREGFFIRRGLGNGRKRGDVKKDRRFAQKSIDKAT